MLQFSKSLEKDKSIIRKHKIIYNVVCNKCNSKLILISKDTKFRVENITKICTCGNKINRALINNLIVSEVFNYLWYKDTNNMYN